MTLSCPSLQESYLKNEMNDGSSYFQQVVALHGAVAPWRETFFNLYEHLDDDEISDAELEKIVRDQMEVHAQKIQDLFTKLKSETFPYEFLSQAAQQKYLSKKANVPTQGENRLTHEQRIYTNVLNRIEALRACASECIEGYDFAFEQLNNGELLRQDTFEDAMETSLQLLIAIEKFGQDFPGLIDENLYRDAATVLGKSIDTPNR